MTIEANLKSLISASVVASAAGFSTSDWANYHVFAGGREMIHGMNRGRAPYVVLWRGNSSYDAQSVDADPGGTLNATWNLRVAVQKHDEALAETQIRQIANACFKSIKDDSRFRPGDQSIGDIQVFPWGSFADCTINIETTFTQSGRIS